MTTHFSKIVVLGATSGIAQELQRLAALDHRQLLLVARSAERLAAIQADLLARGAARVETFVFDFADLDRHSEVLEAALRQLPDFDSVVVAYGSLSDQQDCNHRPAAAVRELQTNFVSQVSLLTLFADHFEQRKFGLIAAFSSVAGDRGRRSNYVYGSSKAGITAFLQGLRARLYKSSVRVVTIKPGPTDTAMTAGMKKTAIFSSAQKVAAIIYRALSRSNPPDVIYVPSRWRLIMFILRSIPESLFKRMNIE